MLWAYDLIVLAAAPFVALYILFFLWRRPDFLPRFSERLGRLPPAAGVAAGAPRFWLHAASVGETTAAASLARALRERFSGGTIWISTCTPAGRATAQARGGDADLCFYLPLDFLPAVEAAIRRLRPGFFLLFESDIWPTLLHRLSRHGVPIVVVNGRISERRLALKFFYRPVLEQVAHFCMQSEADKERLVRLGIDPGRITVTGNVKFAVAQKAASPLRREALGIPEDALLLVGGSTHAGEEEALVRCYRRLGNPKLRLLLAPRYLDRLGEVEGLLRANGLSFARRSEANGARDEPVLLLDTLGELAGVYALADFVFVGGSLVARGGHNLIEPAAHGKALLFGPHMEHYADVAASLLRAGAAIEVKNGEELAVRIEELIARPERRREMGGRAASFVAEQRGALERTVEVIARIAARRESA